MKVPDGHPRRDSLLERYLLVENLKSNVLTAHGLLAAGRGEAFDYLFGEKDHPFMLEAERAAVAALILAKKPVISVNGNVAALVSREIVEFAKLTGCLLEVNLFYREKGRVEAVCKKMQESGASNILGCSPKTQVEMPSPSSMRRFVDKNGILDADVVLVPLEDGDRTLALREEGKFVIAIDLNPLSRTTVSSNIPIINHLKRAIQNMTEFAQEMRDFDSQQLSKVLSEYDRERSIRMAIEAIVAHLTGFIEEHKHV